MVTEARPTGGHNPLPPPPFTVVVADDDRGTREAMAEVLQNQGFRPVLAADGGEAVEIVQVELVHLVLFDMHMPRLTGLEALTLLRNTLDRVLTELTGYYRDVLGLQTGALDTSLEVVAGAHLINAEYRDQLTQIARATTPEQTLRRIDAILACREALEANVAPLLALEALMVQLAVPR